MALFLIEVETGASERSHVDALLETAAAAGVDGGGEVLEASVTGDLARAFVVVEAADREAAARLARGTGRPFTGPDPVRLVGATVDDVRAARSGARYLVEWDFPAELTMDAYLERKKAKGPLYAQVPEVAFLRTYVREDMTKCLCLYDAENEADVRRAREVVDTPVSRVHELGGTPVRADGD
ncbi:DUF4242 domain-containing protein [Patulibacter sp. S7RM1-6]